MKYFSSLVAVSSAAFFGVTSARSIWTRADPATTDPNDDPFYAQPANINTYQPGAVIDHRNVNTAFTGFANCSGSLQLKYRTTDGQGNAVSTVATLWIPKIPRSIVLSYQVAEDALNLDCAPSWAWVTGSGSQNGNISDAEGAILVPQSLTKGYYVIQPDAEGPKSTWLVGNMEGKATLDGIRAAINYNNLNRTQTQVGLYGYSGGAHSTVWAAELHDSYAPELNIVGAAFGGTPVDLEPTYNLLNNRSQALLAGGALFGLSAGYPALEASYQSGTYSLLPNGTMVEQQVRARNFCLNFQLAKFANVNFDSYFKKPVLQNPALRTVLGRESLLMNVSTIGVPVPKFPRFQYHGSADMTVPYAPELAYVQQQCAKNATIQFATAYGADHGPTGIAGLIPALLFLDGVFLGLKQNKTCNYFTL